MGVRKPQNGETADGNIRPESIRITAADGGSGHHAARSYDGEPNATLAQPLRDETRGRGRSDRRGDKETGQPVGVSTEADIVQAVADGKNLNDVRILAQHGQAVCRGADCLGSMRAVESGYGDGARRNRPGG